MKLNSVEKKEKNLVEIEVSVSPEELKAATDKVFVKKAKNINVPGFRKGKAPRATIEKLYGKDVFLEDAINEIYPKAYSDAIDEAGIEPVDRADVEVTSASIEDGFTFKAKVTVKPEVELGEYKGIQADKVIYTVSDSDVDAEIERMRGRNARIISVTDRPAVDGDDVVINFEGFVDGEAFDGGKAENHEITLGSHSFIDTFEQQIEGHNVGDEFDVNVTFPDEYHAENLKSKPALFKVKLVDIKGKEMPELDDEFAKDVSEFDTLDELKADIRHRIGHTKEHRTKDEFENTVVDEVIKGMQVDIPECMIETRINDMVQDFEYRISQQGMNLDMYLQYTGMTQEAFRASFREQAEKQVKIRLALEKIADVEKIEPSEEEISAEYDKIAETYKMPADNIRKMIPEKELVGDLKTQKAIDFVCGNAVVTEKTEEEQQKEAATKKDKTEDNAEGEAGE